MSLVVRSCTSARARACVSKGRGCSCDGVYLVHVVGGQVAAREAVVAQHERLRGVEHQPEALVRVDRLVVVALRHARLPLRLVGARARVRVRVG